MADSSGPARDLIVDKVNFSVALLKSSVIFLLLAQVLPHIDDLLIVSELLFLVLLIDAVARGANLQLMKLVTQVLVVFLELLGLFICIADRL